MWLNIVGVAAGVTVRTVTWQKAIVPGFRTMRTTMQIMAALLDIGKEYPSGNGSTLGEAIRSIETEVGDINGNVKALANKIDVFILDRQPNGQRHSDP